MDAGLKEAQEFAALVEQLALPKPAPPRVRADLDHGAPPAGAPAIEAVGADASQVAYGDSVIWTDNDSNDSKVTMQTLKE